MAATCIDLETIAGARRGKLCVDKLAGYLIYERIDDLVIKQSKFKVFNNGFLPGHIERWNANTKLVEINENIVVRTDFLANYVDYPAGATISHACNSFIPAYAENTPQPAAKAISETGIDINVFGFVGKDGKTFGLKVPDTTRPDLAEESLKIVSASTFHPAQCNYQPTATSESSLCTSKTGCLR